MPFGLLGQLIGYGQNQADQNAAQQGMAGGGQQAAIDAAQNVPLNDNRLMNIAIQNQQVFGRYPEYIAQALARPAPRPQEYARARDYMGALQDIAVSWMNEGMEFSEIVVPKATYVKLQERMNHMGRYQSNADRPAAVPTNIVVATAMGIVKFICEDDRPMKFNLDKYMETVE